IELGLQGPNSTNAMSCASGTIAIGDGFREIRDGYADVMLCGGAEAPLAPLTFGAFAIIRAMSTRNDEPQRASRPFDRDRDGFVMGEGGAVLVLEEYERARARGAHVYAEVVGYGNSNDAHHMTAPRPDGAPDARRTSSTPSATRSASAASTRLWSFAGRTDTVRLRAFLRPSTDPNRSTACVTHSGTSSRSSSGPSRSSSSEAAPSWQATSLRTRRRSRRLRSRTASFSPSWSP